MSHQSNPANAHSSPTRMQLAEQASHAEAVATLDAMLRNEHQPTELLQGLLCGIADAVSETQPAYAAGVSTALYAVILRGLSAR